MDVPADRIGRIDPAVVLSSLTGVSEALFAAGITDPHELFRYVHVSDEGNAAGGSVGGVDGMAWAAWAA